MTQNDVQSTSGTSWLMFREMGRARNEFGNTYEKYEYLHLSFNFERNSNEISSDFLKSNNSKSRTSFKKSR